MSNIKKANIGKGLGNGLAFGVTSGIAVSFAREIIQAIEDAKLEKKRRNPKTDSNTVVLHVPKELEKPASARDDFDDAKANDGKEIELKTPERDKAGRFTPNWVSKQAGVGDVVNTAGGVAKPVATTIGGLAAADFLSHMFGSMGKSWERLKDFGNTYGDSVGTIAGSTAGIVGGYILARKLAQKLEEARLKREIAAAQKEYANLILGKKASCDILDIGLDKQAEDPIYTGPTADRNNKTWLDRGFSSTYGFLADQLKKVTDQNTTPSTIGQLGEQAGRGLDNITAKGVDASAKVLAGTTVATIIAALAIAHVTKKVLKQKYGNPNVKRDVVPRTTSVILKASEDNSFEISPATAIVTLGYIKEAMAYDMNKPILDGIKKAYATPAVSPERFMPPGSQEQAVVPESAPASNPTGQAPQPAQTASAAPATTPQAVNDDVFDDPFDTGTPAKPVNTAKATQRKPGMLIDDPNMFALAIRYMARPENFRAQLYRQFNPNATKLPEGYSERGFTQDDFDILGNGKGELAGIRIPYNNADLLDLFEANKNSGKRPGEFIGDKIKQEFAQLKETDPKRYDAFIGQLLQTNPELIKIINSDEFAENVNQLADERINNYFSPKDTNSKAPTTFGNAISSGWLGQLPFYNWLRQIASWLFKNTRIGHAMGLRSYLGQYTKNPGELLMRAYGNGPVYNPNTDKEAEFLSKQAGLPGLEDITNINILGDASNTALDEKLDQLLGRLPGSRRETKRKYVSITGDKETQALIKKKRKHILKILQDLNAEYSEQ